MGRALVLHARQRADGVKPALTLAPQCRQREEVENPEFAAFARRIIRAAGRRVAEGDPADLGDLVALRSDIDAAIGRAVAGLRSEPWSYSWSSIAEVLGTTRQAAQQRYGAHRLGAGG